MFEEASELKPGSKASACCTVHRPDVLTATRYFHEVNSVKQICTQCFILMAICGFIEASSCTQ